MVAMGKSIEVWKIEFSLARFSAWDDKTFLFCSSSSLRRSLAAKLPSSLSSLSRFSLSSNRVVAIGVVVVNFVVVVSGISGRQPVPPSSLDFIPFPSNPSGQMHSRMPSPKVHLASAVHGLLPGSHGYIVVVVGIGVVVVVVVVVVFVVVCSGVVVLVVVVVVVATTAVALTSAVAGGVTSLESNTPVVSSRSLPLRNRFNRRSSSRRNARFSSLIRREADSAVSTFDIFVCLLKCFA